MSLTGRDFCQALSGATDRWLTGLLGDEPDVALIAVGGYGRGELSPGSDLDLVLLHRGRNDIGSVAERIWYAVWDTGVGLDHSVRTVRETVHAARADMRVALGLLDARLVAGDTDLHRSVANAVLRQWRQQAARVLPALEESMRSRHAQFGEVAFLLEPDLKEGRGGLRDMAALRAAGAATIVVQVDESVLVAAEDTLLAVRVELHRRLGKGSDRLALQEQDGVAEGLGFADADVLMAAVAGAARTISWASDDGWRRVRSSLAGPRGRESSSDRPLGPGLVIRDGEVVLTADAHPAADASLALRAAVASAETGAPLGRNALNRLAAEAVAPADPWPPSVRDALVALLGAGPAAIAVLETLDQRGLVARLLPEWESVRSLPQRNAYHRFTVDRHLCETAAAAASLTRRVRRPDLLLVGAWLHDIGKGCRNRDHTEAGMEIVARVGARMGFAPEDVELLVGMVAHHLLLPDAATRRDLADPVTIAQVGSAVGTETLLELLAALTEADSLATGPSAWGGWKARLVAELVSRVGDRFAGRATEPAPGIPTDDHLTTMAAGVLDVVHDGERLTVIAPDEPGLLCRVAGTLSLHGLGVRSLDAASDDDGMALQVVETESLFGTPVEWDAVAADLERALDGRLSLDAALDRRVRDYAGKRRSAAARPAAPQVIVDQTGSATATVVEVRAPDGIAVLYRITRALAAHRVDVRRARIVTLGHEVVDTFYLCRNDGTKLGEDDVELVRTAILRELPTSS